MNNKNTIKVRPFDHAEEALKVVPAQANVAFVQDTILPSHDQLLEALFFCWDAFERSNLNLFLVRDTAHQVKANDMLSGDKLTIGIRRMEWNGGQQRVIQAFMDHEKIDLVYMPGDNLMFKYKDVPIYLYIYDENPCLESLDTVFYGNETFLTPNPLDVFEEKYDK